MSRSTILSTWNARFWIICERDRPVFTTEALDVHTAIAELLASQASQQPLWFTPLVGVSIEGSDGPWTTFPIGPGYRQLPEPMRLVVRQWMQAEFPAITNEWLEVVGDDEYVAWRERNEARLQANEGHER